MSMLRLALTPRWLVIGLFLVALMVGATLLGRWQWDRTQTILVAERAAAAQPIAVGEALGDPVTQPLPAESIGRPVFADGQYEVDRQAVVVSRSLDGEPGSWIVTGLRISDGTLVPVLRGWVESGDSAAAAVPSGEVRVEGILQPEEIFYAGAPATAEAISAIARDSLERAWGEQVPPAFVVLTSQQPSPAPAPMPVPPTVQTADVPFPLQNFFYAFQWWIFAAFGAFLYVRWLRIEAGRSGSVD
ncbi:MAG TPA: hypothetical protein DCQ36_00930 [Actinobacteria bacterium]|jgi:cytochrome oxidase assembly protein ShyY1|nr:hypothetical protein [Actinomycetota bacterium]